MVTVGVPEVLVYLGALSQCSFVLLLLIESRLEEVIILIIPVRMWKVTKVTKVTLLPSGHHVANRK